MGIRSYIRDRKQVMASRADGGAAANARALAAAQGPSLAGNKEYQESQFNQLDRNRVVARAEANPIANRRANYSLSASIVDRELGHEGRAKGASNPLGLEPEGRG
jgi:flagellar basal body rod protein FlgB